MVRAGGLTALSRALVRLLARGDVSLETPRDDPRLHTVAAAALGLAAACARPGGRAALAHLLPEGGAGGEWLHCLLTAMDLHQSPRAVAAALHAAGAAALHPQLRAALLARGLLWRLLRFVLDYVPQVIRPAPPREMLRRAPRAPACPGARPLRLLLEGASCLFCACRKGAL
jgi:hypothetical protein